VLEIQALERAPGLARGRLNLPPVAVDPLLDEMDSNFRSATAATPVVWTPRREIRVSRGSGPAVVRGNGQPS